MSAAEPGAIHRFPIPGVSQPSGDAAPDSLLADLRRTAAQTRKQATLTVDIPGRWQGKLRAVYGYVGLDELERFTDAVLNTSNVGASLEILNRACRKIEVYDPEQERWRALEDQLGPVTFDDRLARLLQWERPSDDPEFAYPTRTVYETMWDGNGIALGQHVAKVAEFMGLVEEQAASGEASTPDGSTPSGQPPPSE